MATLTLYFKGRRLSIFPLADGKSTLGRDPDCDIHIDSLAVAPRHLDLLPSATGYLMVALNPDYPVIWNEERVEEARLEHGDLIRVGKHSLTFVSDGQRDGYGPSKAGPDAGGADAGIEGADSGTGGHLSRPADPSGDGLAGLSATGFEQDRELAEACARSAATAAETAAAGGRERSEEDATLLSVPAYMQIQSGSKIGRVIVFRRALNRLDRVGARGVVVARQGDSYGLMCLEKAPKIRIDGKAFDATAPEMGLEDGSVVQIDDLRLQFFIGGAEIHAETQPAEIDPDSILLKDIDDF